MTVSLAAYKVADLETSSDTKFNNLVQACEDGFNNLGDSTKGAWGAGQILLPSQLKQESATDGQVLAWSNANSKYQPTTVSALVGGLPPGAVIDHVSITTPTGVLPADGSAVSRTTYATLLAQCTIALTGATTTGSKVVTGISSTSGLRAGIPVEGAGISAGTTIATVDSATQVTLSANATATGSPTLTFFPWGNGDGSTTFNTPDKRNRVSVGWSATAPALLAGIGANDGRVVAVRSISHHHTASVSYGGGSGVFITGGAANFGNPGGGPNQGSGTIGVTVSGDSNNTDSAAFAVFSSYVKT